MQRTGPGQVLGLPAGLSADFPGRGPPARRALAARCSPSRRPRTFRRSPGDVVSDRPRRPAARDGSHRRRGRAARGGLAVSEGRRAARRPTAGAARQRAHPAARVVSAVRRARSRRRGPTWSAPRRTRRSTTRCRPSPSAAFTEVTGRPATSRQSSRASGLVGDNLGTALDSARSDALYAQILFSSSASRGRSSPALITASIASAGRRAAPPRSGPAADPRRDDRQLVRMALAETALAGGVGAVARPGRGARDRRARLRHRQLRRRARSPRVLWAVGAAARRARDRRAPRSPCRRGATRAIARRSPAPRRAVGRAAASAVVDARAASTSSRSPVRRSSTGRRAATATSSCSPPRECRRYRSTGTRCSRPVLGWLGGGPARLAARATCCWRAGAAPRPAAAAARRAARADRSRRRWAASADCSPARSPWSRSRRRSPARPPVFNSTYAQQAEVDARLTNGADVTVTESPGANVGPGAAGRAGRDPGRRVG